MLSDINNEHKWAVSHDSLKSLRIGSCSLFAQNFQRFVALPLTSLLVFIKSRAGIIKKGLENDNDSDYRYQLLRSI